MAGDAAPKRELREEPLETGLVRGDVRVDLAVRALEIGVGHQPRSAVTRPGNIDHAQTARLDDAIEMRVDEVEPGRGSEVTEQPWLDVPCREGLLQQRVIVEIDLADRE